MRRIRLRLSVAVVTLLLTEATATYGAGTTLYFWGLQREAAQCVEREGVIQYWVNGQSYTIRRTDVTKIEGPCPPANVPSVQGSAPSVVPQSRPSPAELPPLLLAAQEGRVRGA
jgi:hypothetical protein